MKGGKDLTDTSEMIKCTAEITEICASFMSDTPPSPHIFLKRYAYVSDILSADTTFIRLSSELMTVLARTYTLYFAMLRVSELSVENNAPEISAYIRNCLISCCDMAKLFMMLFPDNGIFTDYASARNLALSENESLMAASRKLRFSALDRHGRIFAALPELERIYACTEMLKRSNELCRALDDMRIPISMISDCK